MGGEPEVLEYVIRPELGGSRGRHRCPLCHEENHSDPWGEHEGQRVVICPACGKRYLLLSRRAVTYIVERMKHGQSEAWITAKDPQGNLIRCLFQRGDSGSNVHRLSELRPENVFEGPKR
jgi:NAD-dependent SIR2 family protein deacetylase